jgi:hypothetical protein
MIGVFFKQLFRSCVLWCYVLLHSISWKLLFRGAPFLWCMWSIIGFFQGYGQMKFQMYEIPPRFGRQFVRLRRREKAFEGTWVGRTIHWLLLPSPTHLGRRLGHVFRTRHQTWRAIAKPKIGNDPAGAFRWNLQLDVQATGPLFATESALLPMLTDEKIWAQRPAAKYTSSTDEHFASSAEKLVFAKCVKVCRGYRQANTS